MDKNGFELNPDAESNSILIAISVVTFILMVFIVWVIWYCHQKRLPTQFLIQNGLGRKRRLITVDLYEKDEEAAATPEPQQSSRRPSIFNQKFTVHDIFKVVDKKTKKDGLQLTKEPVIFQEVQEKEFKKKFQVINKPIPEEVVKKEEKENDDVFVPDANDTKSKKFLRQNAVNIDKPAAVEEKKDRRTSKLSNFNRVPVSPPPKDLNPKIFRRTASEDALAEIKAIMSKRMSPKDSPISSISGRLSSPALVLQESKRYSPSGLPLLSDTPPYSPTGETLKYPIPRRVFPSFPQGGNSAYAFNYDDAIKATDLISGDEKAKPKPAPRQSSKGDLVKPVPAPRRKKLQNGESISGSSTDGSDRSTPTANLVPKDKMKDVTKVESDK